MSCINSCRPCGTPGSGAAGRCIFTTKELGIGSGLGLPMVQGFAAQSGGTVQIRSKLGEGTTVELWLPQANEPPPENTGNIRSPFAVAPSGDPFAG